MSKTWRNAALLVIAGCLSPCVPAEAAPQTAASNLVDVGWLEKNLSNPAVVLLDASPAQLYAAQHIPGAVSVDLMTYGGQERPPAEMETLFQSWGVSPGKRIVLYDQGGTFLATRTLFDLYYRGVPAKDLAILDGGLAKWQEAKLPVTKDLPAAKVGTFKVRTLSEDVRVRLPEFLDASGDPAGHVLLEALTGEWHFGEMAPFGRPGHPPYGVLAPSADFFNADKTFKSPDDLRRMLAYLKIGPEREVLTYCGGGVAASVPFFALKFLLGYPRVKLYAESELGYLADERQLPYWTYDAPFLMRDTKWVQTWGGQMVRMYTPAPVSIIDLRAADAFGRGHLAFALNVPAETFSSNLATPEALARALGAAGVNVGHEAVLFSGAGITREAALAFVMLEKLGQKRVSIFTDSMERAAQLGYAPTSTPTAVGPKKSARDLSIPPTAYPVDLRSGVIIADTGGAAGLYPKVVLASGSSLPAQPLDGKVVHVPYTSLLNADGTAKQAKEIWSLLAKAGVSRYAELVCVSDDPGEAAVSYFILKLMGYPDVKLLVR
jgi:thiosulfate/3-mercaptopyruvate sulfurtransferase